MYFYLHRDITNFKQGTLPKGGEPALVENKLYSLDEFGKFWWEILDQEKIPLPNGWSQKSRKYNAPGEVDEVIEYQWNVNGVLSETLFTDIPKGNNFVTKLKV
jgi:hypothetical protein